MATRQQITADWNWTAVRAQCLREAQRVLGRTSDAEDAAQEAAVRAWQKRHACSFPERPEPWIRTIARNEALRISERRRDLPLEEASETGRCDEDRLLLRRAVREAVAELGDEERRLLLGSYWHDLSGAELSRVLGRAEVTVRVQLHRTRGRLREVLEPTFS